MAEPAPQRNAKRYAERKEATMKLKLTIPALIAAALLGCNAEHDKNFLGSAVVECRTLRQLEKFVGTLT